MNTTYDTNFRFKALLTVVGDTLHQWRQRGSEPTLGVVANSIKSWQRDWKNLSGIMQRENGRMSIKSHDVHMLLEDAWENRDNRQLAIKSIEDAYKSMKNVGLIENQDSFVPLYKKRAVKAAFGEQAAMVDYGNHRTTPVPVRVKSWVSKLRDQVADVQEVPQKNRQYIARTPNSEGRVYVKTAARANMWISSNLPSIADAITPHAHRAIKSVSDKLLLVERLGRSGLLDQGARRAIHSQLRAAFREIDNIQPEMRTPAVKTDIFQDVDTLRGRLDNLMPLLENGRYEESDLYRDVTEAIESTRNIATAAPIKYMPSDTWDNFNNLDRSLSQILANRNSAVRVKALRAAAANLDVITSDLSKLDGSDVRPDGQIVGNHPSVKSYGRQHAYGSRRFY